VVPQVERRRSWGEVVGVGVTCDGAAALAAGELLLDFQKLWIRATVQERHDLLKGMISRVFVDLRTGRIVGVTPCPAFFAVFESVRVQNPRVLLLKPDEVKQRLAEQQVAEDGLGGDGGVPDSPLPS